MSKSAHHNARRAGVVVAGVTAAAALATGQRRPRRLPYAWPRSAATSGGPAVKPLAEVPYVGN